ncbi:hypothetical protein B0H19DRAFT_1060524 [Mycena capillaripes]|nr:hypothetical protein B0H19DRAFT_1060524 [Mycena capillaripes]
MGLELPQRVPQAAITPAGGELSRSYPMSTSGQYSDFYAESKAREVNNHGQSGRIHAAVTFRIHHIHPLTARIEVSDHLPRRGTPEPASWCGGTVVRVQNSKVPEKHGSKFSSLIIARRTWDVVESSADGSEMKNSGPRSTAVQVKSTLKHPHSARHWRRRNKFPVLGCSPRGKSVKVKNAAAFADFMSSAPVARRLFQESDVNAQNESAGAHRRPDSSAQVQTPVQRTAPGTLQCYAIGLRGVEIHGPLSPGPRRIPNDAFDHEGSSVAQRANKKTTPQL